MEQSSVLKSKQLPFWYLSTVVEENRCEGWPQRGGAGQRGRACHAPAIAPPRSLGPSSAAQGGSARQGLPRPRHPPHAAWAPPRLLALAGTRSLLRVGCKLGTPRPESAIYICL